MGYDRLGMWTTWKNNALGWWAAVGFRHIKIQNLPKYDMIWHDMIWSLSIIVANKNGGCSMLKDFSVFGECFCFCNVLSPKGWTVFPQTKSPGGMYSIGIDRKDRLWAVDSDNNRIFMLPLTNGSTTEPWILFESRRSPLSRKPRWFIAIAITRIRCFFACWSSIFCKMHQDSVHYVLRFFDGYFSFHAKHLSEDVRSCKNPPSLTTIFVSTQELLGDFGHFLARFHATFLDSNTSSSERQVLLLTQAEVAWHGFQAGTTSTQRFCRACFEFNCDHVWPPN